MQKHSQTRFSFLAVIPLVILLTACGGAVSQGGFNDPSGGSGNSLAITTSSLPAGQAQTAYQTTLAASGGTGPYSWQVASGQLPPGLSLNATTGEISGTPSTTGQFNFTAEVTDSSQPSSQVATRALMIDITAPSGPAVTVSPILVSVQIGGSQQFSATVTGPANTAVDWLVDNVQGGNSTVGTISTGGLYTAPANLPNPVTVTVTAVSAADSSLSANATVTIVDASLSVGLDIYGGCAVCGITGQVTGFFHLEKINGRWWFIDPLGNPFWMKAIYALDHNAIGGKTAAIAKYGSLEIWADQVNRRMKAWEFNTVGEYSQNRVRPYGTFGGSPPPDSLKLPAIAHKIVSSQALSNSRGWIPEPVNDIIVGVPTSTYNGWRAPLVDVYDPDYTTVVQKAVEELDTDIVGGLASQQWIIGVTLDDADELFGFKGEGAGGGKIDYPHPSFLILATNPTRQGAADPTVYSKLALRDFLQQKYGTLASFNAAWGSTYTSWDSAGGFGTGTGLLDEDGNASNHPWVGSDPYDLSDAAPAVKQDLDDFLFVFATHYFKTVHDAFRAVDSNHLLFGPGSIGAHGGRVRAQVLQAGKPYVDAWQFTFDRDPFRNPTYGDSVSGLIFNYDQTGQPAFTWMGQSANLDSPLTAEPDPWPMGDATTQEERALMVEYMITTVINLQGSNGDHFIVGYDFWSWGDNTREKTNWGLVTFSDNAYDGKEAAIATGTDPWGFPTGGEAANYGDFLSTIIQLNKDIYCFTTGANCN